MMNEQQTCSTEDEGVARQLWIQTLLILIQYSHQKCQVSFSTIFIVVMCRKWLCVVHECALKKKSTKACCVHLKKKFPQNMIL